MRRLMRASGVVLTLLALALALSNCGGKASLRAGLYPKPQAAPGEAGALDLPSPASLAQRSADFTELGLIRNGSAYEPSLPHNHVSAIGLGASFTPTGPAATTLAYATYPFSLDGYNRDGSVRLTWGTAPGANLAWVALANFTAGHWDWYQLPPDNILPISNLADVTGPAPDFNLYVVVMVTGTNSANLSKLRIGTQPTPGNPAAVIEATPVMGHSPLDVTFDAGASLAMSPASIASYDFDYGEGLGFESHGSTYVVSHTYAADGTYTARVRVTDIFGGNGIASTKVTVGNFATFDETENNDTLFTGNPLPPLPFKGYRANVGSGGSYDGDQDDHFTVSANIGDTVQLRLNYNAPAKLQCELYDAGARLLTSSTSPKSPNTLRYKVQPGDTQPMVLHVFENQGHASDYLIDGALNPPTAALDVTPPAGPVPLSVVLDASGSTDVAPGTIVSYQFDPEGDGSFLPAQVSSTLNFDYTNSGAYKAAVRVRDNDGNTASAVFFVLVGINYDEIEDNDDIATATPLPALPFTGFTGNCGAGGTYDGDDADYFSFMTNPGTTVGFVLDYPGPADLNLELQDHTGRLLAEAKLTGSEDVLTYTLAPLDAQPLILVVYSATGDASDYTLLSEVNPPRAKLVATPHKGNPPLDVVLDASGSFDLPPGSIVGYEFDPEGDGTYLPQQLDPTLPFTYTDPGIYRALVRVQDNESNISLATAVVLVGVDLDEVEDDDFPRDANELTLPVAGFKGSLGSGPGYPGYDGDHRDYYSFMSNITDVYRFTVTYDNTTGENSLDVTDDGATFTTSVAGKNGSVSYTRTVTGIEQQPFIVNVHSASFYGDYTVDVVVNPPNAILNATPNQGDPPLMVTLDASGSSDRIPGSIVSYEFDPEGDGTYLAPQVDPTMDFTYPVIGVVAPAVRVTDDEGNQSVATALVLVGVTYSEFEPNDTTGTANQLPASLNFSNYLCSLGSGPGYHGYDGSQVDYFRAVAQPGADITLTADYVNTTGELTMDLYDHLGYKVAQAFGSGGTCVVSYTVGSDPNDGGVPYYLKVWDPGGLHYGDYTMSGTRVP